jgi:hypothetical protein
VATWSEFTTYMITCAVVMGTSVVYLAYIRFRYKSGARALRRMTYWYLSSLVVIATIARWSEVTETRCRRNPMEFCRYNDGVPVMAVIAMVFFVAGIIRARLAYADR